MSLQVGTGKAGEANSLLEALARGREDRQFFSQTFLNRTLHDGQVDYVENANATINLLATANRYGKTTVLLNVHAHANIYKTGGEPRYLDAVTGAIDQEGWVRLKYHTIHTAGDFETTTLVWDDAHKALVECPKFRAMVKDAPRSKPPHITFIHGSRWKFRTLGHNASGIDGNSFYVISIDEAGWIDELESMMGNVIRVRVADVRGVIHLVGTFKPGVSKDFYKFAVRAAAYTGIGITLDHRAGDEQIEVADAASLDASIQRYLREFFRAHPDKLNQDVQENLRKIGITDDELVGAISGG